VVFAKIGLFHLLIIENQPIWLIFSNSLANWKIGWFIWCWNWIL